MNFPKLGIGVGFRMHHFPEMRTSHPSIEWLELITDHFILPTKKTLLTIEYLRERYSLVLHGVGLGIGNPLPLDFEYLRKVKALARLVKSPWVSEHLSLGQIPGAHFHELLPLPFKKEVADYVAEKAKIVQDFLEVPFALENISTTFQEEDREMEEWEFYSYVVDKSETYMMLDINNMYVNSRNLNFDINSYLAALPFEKIIQIHLAGHTDQGRWVYDTHNQPVRDEVWELYRQIWIKGNQPSTLLEWDENYLSFEETCKEALKAKQFQLTSPK